MARADEATRFKPGQSGNPKGSPRGSRHTLSEAALRDLCADFEVQPLTSLDHLRADDHLKTARVLVVAARRGKATFGLQTKVRPAGVVAPDPDAGISFLCRLHAAEIREMSRRCHVGAVLSHATRRKVVPRYPHAGPDPALAGFFVRGGAIA
jgi:Family of unknown function (DUF5681)